MLTLAPEAGASALRARLAGDAVGRGEDGYDAARRAWNLTADQRPAIVAFARSAADVVSVVDFAREHGLRVAPQGTGHGATALPGLDDAILLSTSRMRGVEIDPVGRRARVQAGALWLEVTAPASEHGLAPLAGSSPDVGVVGYCLGGGLSWLARAHGLASDSVLAVELVTADGRLIRADAEHHADLFWALRGGGGSFGVVCAMEIALHPVPELHAGVLAWPVERAAEVLHAWREWTATAPEAITTSIRVLHVPPAPMVMIDGALLGSAATAAEVLAPFRALEPTLDTWADVAPVALSRIHGDPEEPVPALTAHRVLRELPAAAVDAFAAVAGPPLAIAELRHLGGAAGRSGPGAGAATLAGPYVAFAVGITPVPEAAEAVAGALPRVAAALDPWSAEHGYLNYEEQRADSSTLFPADTYARLAGVKGRVDPADLFLANHPIRPAVR